ncbi:efflux RND transporter permease subunit [Endozoicomonas sp.]|uniref:efflux RND transporter permease subunit n=1 Tax=Endozoicomonas sp. TaxID=1892382 RepID=UPI003AF64CFA
MNWLSRKLFLQTLFARLLLGLFLLSGVLSYNTMVRENYPDLEIPKALITVSWPGAAPEQVEKEVTKPLEDEIRSVKGLKTFASGSYHSYSMVAVEFEADMPVAEALQRLRAKVDKAESQFPSEADIDKPEIEEMSVADMPVISLVLHGNVDDLILTDVAKRLESQFETIPTVKKVTLGGMREKSLHIRLKPYKLRELGISPLLVRDRLQAANQDMAWGEFEGSESTFTLYLAGRFDSVEKLKKLPITRFDENRPVRLGEIADVSLRLDREKSRNYFSLDHGEFTRGITLDITKRPGEDTFAVIGAAERLADQVVRSDTWPQGLQLTKVTDDGELIELAFEDISGSMYQAVIIVFVVLMFLLTWREALIAGIALPVTLLATLAGMAVLGYTLSSTVLVGMVLALGLLVDVYILVMEGMHDGLYVRKQSFSQAALSTVKTFLLPATAGQLTTILAMVPLMLVGGIPGKFIRILPMTITISLLVSLLVAFLVCIPLSRYLLEKDSGRSRELLIDRLSMKYRGQLTNWLLVAVLKNRITAISWVAGAFGLFVLSLLAAGQLPVMMFSESDDRKIGVAIQLGPDATLEQAQQVADKAGAYLREQPWIEKNIAYVGEKSPVTSSSLNEALLPSKAYNQVGFTAILVPRKDRGRISFEYLDDIREGLNEALSGEAGLEIFLTHVGGNPYNAAPVQIEILGEDYGLLRDISGEVRSRLSQIPGAQGVRDNLGAAHREIRFRLIPERLSFHGLSEHSVAQQIRMAMEEDDFGRFKVPGIQDDPDIRISMAWASRGGELGSPQHIAEMQLMRVITDDGRSVPLLDLAEYELMAAPQVYVHTDGQRAVTVQARAEGQTATTIMKAMIPHLEAMKREWPIGYDYRLAGEMESTDESYGSMGGAMLLAMGMIFVLLTLMFNSMRQPLIILLVVPLALTGTFIGYFLAEIPMSFIGLMGVVSLAGIAVNNGIVLIETMNSHRKSGLSVANSAARGAADRLRPVISTSLTTVLGLIPLASSDPQWYPLCMAIIFGLAASTVFAMVVVPALYVLLTSEVKATVASSDNSSEKGAELPGFQAG